MLTVRRALLSVSDKHGLIPFATGLAELGVELLSTGGTCRALRDAGIEVIEVSDKTGFPEIMDGRVKTLHPVIHGGLLGRRGVDEAVMREHGIEPIDLLVVNLYPFARTIARSDASIDEAIENIDIGGPAMIRAASKNHESVAVLVDPEDYDSVLEALNDKVLSPEMRRRLAAKAFAHTASYDTAITKYLTATLGDDPLGERFLYSGDLLDRLRYGENPHQAAAFYVDPARADRLARDGYAVAGQGAVVQQHRRQRRGTRMRAPVRRAGLRHRQARQSLRRRGRRHDPRRLRERFRTDPTSAFGGIIAFNRALDAKTARAIVDQQFVEVIVAPDIAADAAAVLAQRKMFACWTRVPWRTATRRAATSRRCRAACSCRTATIGRITAGRPQSRNRARADAGAESRTCCSPGPSSSTSSRTPSSSARTA